MRRAVCPGSFDPPTNGHLDVIGRTAALFDEIVVAVLVNKNKKSLFTVDERMAMLREIVAPYPNVRVASFHGLLVDYCKDNDIQAIVKGLRVVTDFEYELQMAQMNSTLLPQLDTMFVTAKPEWAFLSSSLVKEVARFGGSVDGLVPPLVARALIERFGGGGG
jgi:pantetheine-phosphate adenylyltransferase